MKDSDHLSSGRNTQQPQPPPSAQQISMVRAVAKVLELRSAPAPTGTTPRANSRHYIEGVLAKNGKTKEDTVGGSIAASIGMLEDLAGERGADRVDEFFTNPANDQYYLTLESDKAKARESHQAMATGEVKFWTAAHGTRPSIGTRIATSFSVADRVELTHKVSEITKLASAFQQHGAGSMDPFGTFSHTAANHPDPSTAGRASLSSHAATQDKTQVPTMRRR
ncbi:hypothetical protein [Streptomyces tauricus]|uniref:hypothetical protein n=1 Tax=Streptomyces tauricus TaxID=68274 RepID=UPI0022442AAD|nr:hypothetical protein [Streptomyces tauricus]MCW8103625.1 hypothetical protein [Streptomyces tauricus]